MKAIALHAGRGALLALSLSVTPACAIAQAGGSNTEQTKIADLPLVQMDSGPVVKLQDPKTGISIVGIAYDRNGVAIYGKKHPSSENAKTPDVSSLIQHLEGVSNQKEFDAAILEWQRRKEATAKTGSGAVPAPYKPPSQVTSETSFATDSGNGISPLPTKPGDESLLIAMSGAAWIGLGSSGAPIVYMITNVSCPDCITSMNTLLPLAQAGKIDLRLILTPTDDQNLIDLSYIATSPDVGSSIVANTISAFKPTSTKGMAPPNATIMKALNRNLGMVKNFGLQRPPIIAFEAKDGATYLRKITDTRQFLEDLEPVTSGK